MPDVSVLAAPRPKRTSHSWWGEVVSTSPLRVHLEGEANPVDATPVTCVWGLEVGDKVRGETTVDGVLVVLARGGGLGFENVDGVADVGQVPGLPASKITSGTLDADRRWVGAPYAMAAGSVVITPSALNTPASATVTFPAGRFTAAPIVTATAGTGNPAMSAVAWAAPTPTGMTVYITRSDSVSALAIHWHAVQMTDTNASG